MTTPPVPDTLAAKAAESGSAEVCLPVPDVYSGVATLAAGCKVMVTWLAAQGGWSWLVAVPVLGLAAVIAGTHAQLGGAVAVETWVGMIVSQAPESRNRG